MRGIMLLLSKRSVLGIAAVVDIAIHARNGPVSAKGLAKRHNLPPRHLETLLQALVHTRILKGMRGPKGGYELARERRRISVADVVRAAMTSENETADEDAPSSDLISLVVEPSLQDAGQKFLASLEDLTVEDLCRHADEKLTYGKANSQTEDFTI